MIKAIIFDCFGVLTTDTWKDFVDSLPPEADVQTARDFNRAYGAGVISRDEFMEGVQAATGRQPREVERLLEHEITKNTKLLNYIAELGTGYKIGLLSNIGTNWIRTTFLTAAEQNLFDTMVMSFEVGMTKPEPEMFTLICERLNVAPGETIMIDDMPSYIEGARLAGLKGVIYVDFGQFKRDLQALL